MSHQLFNHLIYDPQRAVAAMNFLLKGIVIVLLVPALIFLAGCGDQRAAPPTEAPAVEAVPNPTQLPPTEVPAPAETAVPPEPTTTVAIEPSPTVPPKPSPSGARLDGPLLRCGAVIMASILI